MATAVRVAAEPGPPPVVHRLADYRGRPGRSELTARVGMAVFLGSWAMMFLALFFAYGLVRARAAVWPPVDQPPLPLLLPGLNTLAAAASSASVAWGLRALRGGLQRPAARRFLLAALFGTLFLCLQAAVWTGLWRAGLRPDGGPYPSAFYALTALHALHVVVGVLALAAIALRARAGRAGLLSAHLWAMFWHGVGAVWLAIYAVVYVS